MENVRRAMETHNVALFIRDIRLLSTIHRARLFRITPGITRRPERLQERESLRVGGRVHAVVMCGSRPRTPSPPVDFGAATLNFVLFRRDGGHRANLRAPERGLEQDRQLLAMPAVPPHNPVPLHAPVIDDIVPRPDRARNGRLAARRAPPISIVQYTANFSKQRRVHTTRVRVHELPKLSKHITGIGARDLTPEALPLICRGQCASILSDERRK